MPPVAGSPGCPVTTPDGRVGGWLCRPTDPDLAAPLLVCVHGSGCSSRYFDLASNSLAAAAVRRGLAVLLVDRPGHGASASPVPGSAPGSAIDRGVAAVAALIAAVRADHPGLAAMPIALIGHSFGGAIALAYAAGSAPVAALCVSGIGDWPDTEYAALRTQAAAGAATKPAPYWLFGPGSSYDWRGVTALRAATASWRADEVDEVVRLWPTRWAAVAAAITCPVQLRLAEFERIWETTPASVERIAAGFTHARHVDVAIAAGGGHLYEAHLRGPELVAAQLDFVRDTTAGA